MKRYAQEKKLAMKRYRWWMQNMRSQSATGEIVHSFERAPGHFRKRHPMDCGNPRCKLCHREKVFHRPTVKQRSADIALACQLQEI